MRPTWTAPAPGCAGWPPCPCATGSGVCRRAGCLVAPCSMWAVVTAIFCGGGRRPAAQPSARGGRPPASGWQARSLRHRSPGTIYSSLTEAGRIPQRLKAPAWLGLLLLDDALDLAGHGDALEAVAVPA